MKKIISIISAIISGTLIGAFIAYAAVTIPVPLAPGSNYVLLSTTTGYYVAVATSSLGIGGGGSGTVTSVAQTVPLGFAIGGSPVTTSGTLAISLTPGYIGPFGVSTSTGGNVFYFSTTSNSVNLNIPTNIGTVTSVGQSVPTGFTIGGSPVTTSGTLALGIAAGYTGAFTTSSSTSGSVFGLATTSSSLNLITPLTTGTGSWVQSISPALTSTPTTPTGISGDSSTQIANDAFVSNAIATLVTFSYASSTFASTTYVQNTYVPYSNASSSVNLNAKNLTNVANLAYTNASGTSETLANNLFVNATSTLATSTITQLGIASTSPINTLSVGSGSIVNREVILATSTTMTINAAAATSSNQLLLKLGTSAMTVTIANLAAGQNLLVNACNPPNAAAGFLTWAGVMWSSTASSTLARAEPTPTLTANNCDIWSFEGTQGTSTANAVDIFAAQNPNY